MDHSWKAVNSRAALLFFIVAFLTFMSISGFPAFQEDMQVRGRRPARTGGTAGPAAAPRARAPSSLVPESSLRRWLRPPPRRSSCASA